MANESYTLIVVPHAKARFRKFQIPVRLAKWAGVVSSVGALLVTGVLVHYTMISAEVHELRRLRMENKTLLEKNQEYEKNAGKLQARLTVLQRMVNKLGVMAGLEQSLPDSAVGGVGGVSSLESVAPSVEMGLSLQSMEQAAASLTDRSARLEEFYRDQKLLLASTPSVWPVRGYLSAGFGNRIDPFTGLKDFHSGIDISTPRGTAVAAPAEGTVVACNPRAGAYGNAIIIDHGYGIVTRYGHLDGFNVKPGQRVKRGEVIGFVGSTGRSTAPHLHYEVWVRDEAQNPIQFILDEYRSFG
jgi:murein DD-endopeptidase MepM/ murein hydrolase activator NlpD